MSLKMPSTKKFALTIAGSDSSGGAGVQADLRVFGTTGIVGASAITAITAQGANGVVAVELVDPNLLELQISEAFEMYEFGAVKIGMLGGADQAKVVVASLNKYKPRNVVLDPVITSTSGTALLDDDGVQVLKDRLIPLADVLTPNRQELAQLTGMTTETDEECIAAVATLETKEGCVVVVTGGDGEPLARDLIIGLDEVPLSIEDQHVDTPHTHGTGCAFSAWIARCLIEGNSVERAIRNAKVAVNNALQFPVVPKWGRGHPDLHRTTIWHSAFIHAGAAKMVLHGIYVLTDPNLNSSQSHCEMIEAAMNGGAATVQLRDKTLSTPELIAMGKEIRAMTLGRALFIVNDRVDVALACDADGVHLGPDDMAPNDARRLLGWSRIIGCSVSTWEEAQKVAAAVSYIAVGAVFGSSTKDDAGPAVGASRVREIKSKVGQVPVVAIGGINLSNIASVAAAGADAAAVVSAIVCAEDPAQATRDLLAEFERGKKSR